MTVHVQVMPRQQYTPCPGSTTPNIAGMFKAHLVIWSPMMSALRMARCLRAKIACFKIVNCRQKPWELYNVSQREKDLDSASGLEARPVLI